MWKFTDGTGIIILHDVAARTGDGHGIQQLEEIVAQVVEQPFRCAFFRLQFCPVVIYFWAFVKMSSTFLPSPNASSNELLLPS